MKNSDRVLLGLGLGLIIGGTAGYFLASEEGQKFQKKTKKKLRKMNEDVQKTLKEKSNVMTSKLGEATDKAKSWANDVSETVKNKISRTSNKAEDAIEDVTDSFETGAEKARRTIANKTNKLDDLIADA